MDVLLARPVTIPLALISMWVWSAGNRNGNKRMVYAGIAISAAATITFFLGI